MKRLTILAAAAALATMSCSARSRDFAAEKSPSSVFYVETPSSPPPSAAARPESLYYDDSGEEGAFNALWHRPLGRGKATRLLLGNAHQGVGVVIGPGVRRLVLVNDERPDIGGDDFEAQPAIRLYDADAGTYVTLGSGYGVELSPDGTRLAWLAPTKIRMCSAADAGCKEPPAVIKIARMTDLAHPRQWGPFEGLRGISWADRDRLLVFQHGDATSLFAPSDGRLRPVNFGARVVDLSPATGLVLLRDTAQHLLRVAYLDNAIVWQRRWSDEFVEGTLGRDGRTVLVSAARKTGATSVERLLLIDLATDAERGVPDVGHVNGEKLWSTSGRSFAFRRETPDGARFELVMCPADLRTTCRVVHTWSVGLSILALDD